MEKQYIFHINLANFFIENRYPQDVIFCEDLKRMLFWKDYPIVAKDIEIFGKDIIIHDSLYYFILSICEGIVVEDTSCSLYAINKDTTSKTTSEYPKQWEGSCY